MKTRNVSATNSRTAATSKSLVQDPKTEIRDTGHPGFHVPLSDERPGKAVDITMPIEEGDQYRLKEITFNGQ